MTTANTRFGRGVLNRLYNETNNFKSWLPKCIAVKMTDNTITGIHLTSKKHIMTYLDQKNVYIYILFTYLLYVICI